ncbi:MAG: VanZ family protein [Deltaproteobacteria bacterium]|nr:VanZ family protein [Deltaproteobacteria bacterium]MBW2360662.1 VanZ family protein [Deltaproteobacteria bacterium]
MRQIPRHILWAWLFVALWVLVIMSFASDSFSATRTSGLLTPLLRWLDPEMSWERIREIHALTRKMAHAVEYAVLAILGFRAFRITLAVPLLHVALLTLGIVLAVAGLDELRQSWIPTRSGSLADVALDCAGGALAVIALILVHRRLGVRSPVASSGA